MKKLDFNNGDIEDDKNLIDILKTSTLKEPSEQFVDTTMKKFRALEKSDKVAHKPLKTPLYLMGLIGVFLSIPFILKMDIPNFLLEGIHPLEIQSTDISPWYIVTFILLFITGRFVIWVETGSTEKHGPMV
ncbi:hypothetical protein [Ulvibacterium sp.]|uniref:hypothetical protein n=1 Tax=Ulvibacterium sp. TaxID=2665914 RepID=UPI003CC5F1C8